MLTPNPISSNAGPAGRRGWNLVVCEVDLRVGGAWRSPDELFARCLPLIEAAAGDERNFVKKSVNWALRAVGGRNRKLCVAALKVARRLAATSDRTARWIGKDAIRALTRGG